MSNLRHKCCCADVPSLCDRLCCSTSYNVGNFSFNYMMAYTITGTTCNQLYCFKRNYSISLTFQKTGAFVVSLDTAQSGSACCYTGTGNILVTGTVTVEEILIANNQCSPPGPFVNTNTYTVNQETCCCISATPLCLQSAQTCTGIVGPALIHQLEIGDFVVTCNHEGIVGDCDTCMSQYGPYGLRCIGGRFSWASNIDCLDVVTPTGSLGWHYPQIVCGKSPCFSNISLLDGGPFAIHLIDECSAGVDDHSCTDQNGARFLDTRPTNIPQTIDDELVGPCTNVDSDFEPCSTINISVQQQGNPLGFWAYT